MADFVNKGDAPLAHAVHEGLLKVSDRVRQETAAQSTLGVGDAKSRGDVESMLAFAKKCVFQSVFLLTNPAMGSGGLWIVERLIIWLQVRVAVLRELGVPWPTVFSVRRCTQLLSFPLAAVPELSWGATNLAELSKFLGYLSLRTLGNPTLEAAMYWLGLAYCANGVTGFLFIGYAASAEKAIPQWFVQVRCQGCGR